MSATLRNNAEGGVHGADVTMYNSGAASGDSFTHFNLGSGATVKYSNLHKRGAMAYEQSLMQWRTLPPQTVAHIRFALFVPAAVSGTSLRFLEIADDTNACMTLGIRSNNQISLRDNTSANMADSTVTVRHNQWMRFELVVTSHATAGQATLKIFTEADSPYPAEIITTAATFNTRPNNLDISKYNFGIVSFNVANTALYMDDMSVSTNALIGPVDGTLPNPTRLNNTLETGSAGQPVTALNSGDASNHFFDSISTVGTVEYSATQQAHGSLSMRLTGVDGDVTHVLWRQIASSAAAFRVYAYFTGFPSVPMEFAHMTTSLFDSFTLLSRFALASDGYVQVHESAAAGTGAIWTSPAPLSLNTWYRFEMYASLGGTATTGTIEAAYYALDSTTPIASFSSSTAHLGTVNFAHLRFGKLGSSTWSAPMYFDDIAVQQNAVGFVGPYTAPGPVPAAFSGIIPPKGWGVKI
jgi:hypothetical protein